MELVWEELQIEATEDERSIKRAYAKRLKHTRPEDDPAGFQKLREAYERALSYAKFHAGQQKGNSSSQDSVNTSRALNVDFHEEDMESAYRRKTPAQEQSDQIQLVVGQSMQELFECFKEQGDEKTSDLLEHIVASDTYINLEARQMLEQSILNALNSVESPPIKLVSKCSELFRWYEHDHPLRGWFGQLMHYVDHMHSAIEARKTLEAYVDTSNWRGMNDQIWRQRSKAAKLLLKDWDENYFEKQAKKPKMAEALKELMKFIQEQYGNSYQMFMDQPVVDYWERVVKTPLISPWFRVALYVLVYFGTYFSLNFIGQYFVPELREKREFEHALLFISAVVAIPFYILVRSMLHILLFKTSVAISAVEERATSFNQFLRHDGRMMTIFGAVTVVLPFLAFNMADDIAYLFVVAAYALVFYWLRNFTFLIWIALMGLFFNMPLYALVQDNILDYMSPPKAHLVTLLLSFAIIGGYIWLCNSNSWRIFPRGFSLVIVFVAIAVTANIGESNNSSKSNIRDQQNGNWNSIQSQDNAQKVRREAKIKQMGLPREKQVLILASGEHNPSYLKFYKEWIKAFNLCATASMPENLPSTIRIYHGIALARIDQNGRVTLAEIRKKSESTVMDSYILHSIRDCQNLPPLPKYISKDFHQAYIFFSYMYRAQRGKPG